MSPGNAQMPITEGFLEHKKIGGRCGQAKSCYLHDRTVSAGAAESGVIAPRSRSRK